MSNSEVYSWRVSPELKSALEKAARSEQTTVSRLLERIVVAWLEQAESSGDQQSVQRHLHQTAARTLGKIHGRDPRRAERTRDLVRKRLTQRRAG